MIDGIGNAYDEIYVEGQNSYVVGWGSLFIYPLYKSY